MSNGKRQLTNRIEEIDFGAAISGGKVGRLRAVVSNRRLPLDLRLIVALRAFIEGVDAHKALAWAREPWRKLVATFLLVGILPLFVSPEAFGGDWKISHLTWVFIVFGTLDRGRGTVIDGHLAPNK